MKIIEHGYTFIAEVDDINALQRDMKKLFCPNPYSDTPENPERVYKYQALYSLWKELNKT